MVQFPAAPVGRGVVGEPRTCSSSAIATPSGCPNLAAPMPLPRNVRWPAAAPGGPGVFPELAPAPDRGGDDPPAAKTSPDTRPTRTRITPSAAARRRRSRRLASRNSTCSPEPDGSAAGGSAMPVPSRVLRRWMIDIDATILGVMSAVKPPEYHDTNLAL